MWLDSENVHIHQVTSKLGLKQLDPYEVLEKLGDRDYYLKLPSALKIHTVFHVNRLFLWKCNHINGQTPPPPDSIEVDCEEEYEIDEILDSHFYR